MCKLIESKFKFKFTIIAILSIIFPKILNLISNYISDAVINPLYSYLVFAVLSLIVSIIIEFVKYFIKKFQNDTIIITAEKINELGKKYSFEQYKNNNEHSKNELFEITESEMNLVETLLKKRYKPIIYYSLSAKSYFSWIDFCYLSYLKTLSEKIKCKVIICIHPDKKSRLEQTDQGVNLFYKKNISKIIPKAYIIFEYEFNSYKSKNFSTKFHSFYISQILKYWKSDSFQKNSKGNKSEILNTRLGYIESVYNIQEYAKKCYGKKQLFILDRKNSQTIWNSDTSLKNFKAQYHLIFISAATINSSNGEKVNIYNKDNTITLSDTKLEVDSKIEAMSEKDASNIFKLLSIACGNESELSITFDDESEFDLPKEQLQNNILNILNKINSTFDIDYNVLSRCKNDNRL